MKKNFELTDSSAKNDASSLSSVVKISDSVQSSHQELYVNDSQNALGSSFASSRFQRTKLNELSHEKESKQSAGAQNKEFFGKMKNEAMEYALIEADSAAEEESPAKKKKPFSRIESELVEIDRKDHDISKLEEVNENGVSPRRNKKFNQKLLLSKIKSEDEGEESPLVRAQALNLLNKQLVSSPNSKKSENYKLKKGVSSHIEPDLKNEKSIDLPLIRNVKTSQCTDFGSMERSPLKKNRGMSVVEEARKSQCLTRKEDQKIEEQSRRNCNSMNSTLILSRKSNQHLNLNNIIQENQLSKIMQQRNSSSEKNELSAEKSKFQITLNKFMQSQDKNSEIQEYLNSGNSAKDELKKDSSKNEDANKSPSKRNSSLSKSPNRNQRFKKAYDVPKMTEPLPLLSPGIYQEEPEAMWKKRRMKYNQAANKLSRAEQEIQEEKEAFERQQRAARLERLKAEEKLQQVQTHLINKGEAIKVISNLYISLAQYEHHFKYKIYECFKPTNLKQTRNYMEYLTTSEDPGHNLVQEEDLEPELYNYLSKDMETMLPSFINQSKILQFDSNFESGNLDSVYLVNEKEYNLLCKSDTNTKGNTYWFYFKVLNWKPKQTSVFKIMNIARDLTPFYNKGMQIWYRTESTNGVYKSEWQCSNDNVKVLSFQQNDIIRSKLTKKEYACGKYYNTLKFQCEFPEIEILKTPAQQWPGVPSDVASSGFEVGPNDQGAPGVVICFAYALPYTYGDLLSDLEQSKKFLLANDGIIVNHQQKAANPLTLKPRPMQTLSNQNQNKEERRQALTKQQIATRELKKKAIQVTKNIMSKFETSLLKADEETDSPLIKAKKAFRGCKLLEIHTDYLYYKQEIVSQSVGGLSVYQITLTKRKGPNCLPYHKKKCMYISARMHSGETYGSFVMKFILQELVTKAQNYDSILSNYVIKLVPMINPDGVTIGNSRASLVGLDLNRRWADPNASIHPEIYFLKRIMQQQADSSQGITIFCDLHGHNRKFNCFFYGCNKAADEGILSWTKTRLLPKVFASVEQIFDFSNCIFKLDKHKLSSARVVVWNEMKVTNSFTLETSQFAKTSVNKKTCEESSGTAQDEGKKKKKLHYIQLQQSDLHQIAKSYLISTAQYCKLEKKLEKEWKLSEGWFKPSKLYEVVGESVRDKQKRELHQKKAKDSRSVIDSVTLASTTKKRVEKVNSLQIGVEPLVRRRVGKINSNNRVVDRLGFDLNKGSATTTKSSEKKAVALTKLRSTRHLNITLNTLYSDQNNSSAQKEAAEGAISPKDQDSSKYSQKSGKNKKPKGIKIEVTKMNNSSLGGAQPTLTRLKSWKEFFELSEFQQGNALMNQKQDKIKQKGKRTLPQDDDESDSEPSVDNFSLQELEENLVAALDPDAVEKCPFLRPNEDTVENKSVKKQKHQSSDDEFKEEKEILESASDSESQKLVLTQSDHVNHDESDTIPATPVTPKQKNQSLPQAVHQKSFRSISQKHPGQPRNQNILQDRSRVLNFPELANQFIKDIITQQSNQRQMKSSAAPPSGSGMHQGYQIRGNSYITTPSSIPSQTLHDHTGGPVYFTEQNRIYQRNQPNKGEFKILGQGVSRQHQDGFNDTAPIQQHRNQQTMAQTKIGLSTLTPPEQIRQNVGYNDNRKLFNPDHTQNVLKSRQSSKNIHQIQQSSYSGKRSESSKQLDKSFDKSSTNQLMQSESHIVATPNQKMKSKSTFFRQAIFNTQPKKDHGVINIGMIDLKSNDRHNMQLHTQETISISQKPQTDQAATRSRRGSSIENQDYQGAAQTISETGDISESQMYVNRRPAGVERFLNQSDLSPKPTNHEKTFTYTELRNLSQKKTPKKSHFFTPRYQRLVRDSNYINKANSITAQQTEIEESLPQFVRNEANCEMTQFAKYATQAIQSCSNNQPNKDSFNRVHNNERKFNGITSAANNLQQLNGSNFVKTTTVADLDGQGHHLISRTTRTNRFSEKRPQKSIEACKKVLQIQLISENEPCKAEADKLEKLSILIVKRGKSCHRTQYHGQRRLISKDQVLSQDHRTIEKHNNDN